jgi:hypothetical protein
MIMLGEIRHEVRHQLTPVLECKTRRGASQEALHSELMRNCPTHGCHTGGLFVFQGR